MPGCSNRTAWQYITPMKTEIISHTEEEQEEAWQYVCKRKLLRPKTNVFTAMKYALAFIVIVVLLSFLTHALLFQIIFYSKFSFVLFLFFYLMLGLIFISKKIIIGLVHLYQHYAPERVRRKCLFKPTCSEYMILAVEKYGVIKGLSKGFYRVIFRCRGSDYSIDYP